MAKKCVHKGCGKSYEDGNEPCVYHPGPPEFHEGTKGWKCCKPRVLNFDEFLSIPPCTTGKHSDVDDTPASEPNKIDEFSPAPTPAPAPAAAAEPVRLPTRQAQPPAPVPSPKPQEDEDDDPELPIPAGQECKRRGCNAKYDPSKGREGEQCIHHPGAALFHEGSKGWTCCKRRVLEFEEFMKIEGCKTKDKHLFVGQKKDDKQEEDIVDNVRTDFYQTPSQVIASLFLKKIDKDASTIEFSSATTVSLDLRTQDKKRYKNEMQLFSDIDTEKSSYKVMGTKLELTLEKADGTSWAVLRADDPHTGEIIQTGRAGRVQGPK